MQPVTSVRTWPIYGPNRMRPTNQELL
jgi:hypothetical protein